MASKSTPVILTGLARALVTQQWLTNEEAETVMNDAKINNEHFVTQFIKTKKIAPAKLAEFAAVQFGFPYFDLNAIDPEVIPAKLLDSKLMQSRRVIALYQRGSKLTVGLSDPTNLQAIDEIKFQTSLTVDVIVVEDDKLGRLITQISESNNNTIANLAGSDDDIELDFTDDAALAAKGTEDTQEVDDAPIVRYLQKILLDAINDGVSDIHFEPYEKYYRIRYRLDGILREIAQPPLAIKDKLSSRIKVISKLDISEKRVPQDGRMKLVLSKNRAIDFRVSTLPTLYGEKIVMRILDPTSATLGIEALGYEPHQKDLLLGAVQRPYGMVLVTGPTGSGKTVSLYTCLNILNQPGVNIATAEDPAEINLPGINQVNVNEKAGLTFSVALKSFLRQDPDVIMVGEIRDLETAEIAIKAAQTGHMVLSTLHTNDAPSTLTRLMNMGIAPFNIASSVIMITAQRLARKLCKCKQPIDIPEAALLRAGFDQSELDGSWKPYHAVGCELCKGTGYKGRLGIYQVMPITDEMRRIIMNNGNAIDIADQARREGVNDLRRSGLNKVKTGLTSLEEVESVTNE
ncbi:MAG: type IV-A pilus assembly ATPase PilB [Sulfuriferula sp.]